MSDDDTPTEKTVKLKPGKPAAKPKLAPVNTGPKSVVVSVPTAVPVATTATTANPVEAKAAPPMVKIAVSDEDEAPVTKGALLDQVVERSTMKRSDVKIVMEALFEVMGDALRDEKDLQVPPLGKLKFIKSKEVGRGATAVTLKLRTPNTET